MNNSCIILSGGKGTRLRGVLNDTPKCLATFGGRTFLEWQIRTLFCRGVSRFTLSLGYGSDLVIKCISEPWSDKFVIDYIVENEALDTGGAIRFAMASFNLEETLVINGDTYLGGNLEAMFLPLDMHATEKIRLATVLTPNRTRYGGVLIDSSQRIKSFIEKGQAGPGPINAGFYRVHYDAFADETALSFSFEHSVMPRLVKRGEVQARSIEGPFIDIGTPEDYLLFSKNYKDYVETP